MAACYHAEARFSDPVFPDLNAEGVKAMWHMLLGSGSSLRTEFEVIGEDDAKGQVRMEAFYTIGKAGRRVHNIIHSEFEFRDGLIFRQYDRFNFWRWSRQALGATGWFLGWTPFLRKKVRKVMAKRLAKAMRQ